MNLLITYALLEVVAVFVVVALCLAARRADRKTDRMLSAEEVAARHEGAEVHVFADLSAAVVKQTSGGWLRSLFSGDARKPTDRSLL